jgi:LysM repeat protein
MKILKIFGIVVGVHVFALILIFANPGCSSTTKPTADETVAPTDAAAANVPNLTPTPTASPIAAAPASSPVGFNPDAPAMVAANDSTSGGVRFTPTRPGSPAAGALVSEPVADVTPATTYTVVSGDSLSRIAKKTHTTTAELAAANGLKLNATLHPGQRLLVPGKPAAPSAAASTNPPGAVAPAMKKTPDTAAAHASGEVLKHVVKSGETLGGIARKYEVRVADIAVANNIADPAKIKPGQELIIPGWDPKAPGKSGKSSKTPKASQKSGDTKPVFPEPAPIVEPQPTPPAAEPAVPIIKIEDNPIKPAPRP